MPELPVTEPAETHIDEPEGSLNALSEVRTGQPWTQTTLPDVSGLRRVAGEYPQCLAAWADLGELALFQGKAVQAYAYFRVGYHRGLDRIRQAGWRGRGKVPWSHEGNRGFLRSLRGLGEAAGLIGENDEADRCAQFFSDLAPDAPAN